jgi:glycosyltransferase involved in cell wall biosynthesis
VAGAVLSFVIPVRSDARRLEGCLASIRKVAGDTPIEIIVADNGSTDDTVQVAHQAGARVIELPSRPVSDVRNQAATFATSDLLAFVDADHELGSGWVEAAQQPFADPKVWAAGADYHAPADGTWVQRMYDAFRDHKTTGIRPADWLPSGNLIVRRTAFAAVKGFDTTLESCEDVDFCRRIREAGGILVATPALESTHFGDPRTLKALFLSELWRGRDNLRVSLRERLTIKSAPSVVLPLVQLAALVTGLIGLVWIVLGGSSWLVVTSALVSCGLISLRALRLWTRVPAEDRRPQTAVRAWAVAAVYDLARALALVARADHSVRRKA